MNKLILGCENKRPVFRMAVVMMPFFCDLIQRHMVAVVNVGGLQGGNNAKSVLRSGRERRKEDALPHPTKEGSHLQVF
jgi:hypothetical protein